MGPSRTKPADLPIERAVSPARLSSIPYVPQPMDPRMTRPLPIRPRLADHVLARRHITGSETVVVLHDQRTGRLVQLGPREWGLLAAADGTRDLDGVVLAARREGAHARVPALH